MVGGGCGGELSAARRLLSRLVDRREDLVVAVGSVVVRPRVALDQARRVLLEGRDCAPDLVRRLVACLRALPHRLPTELVRHILALERLAPAHQRAADADEADAEAHHGEVRRDGHVLVLLIDDESAEDGGGGDGAVLDGQQARGGQVDQALAEPVDGGEREERPRKQHDPEKGEAELRVPDRGQCEHRRAALHAHLHERLEAADNDRVRKRHRTLQARGACSSLCSPAHGRGGAGDLGRSGPQPTRRRCSRNSSHRWRGDLCGAPCPR
mmetsp:Transcript_11926/g.38319  ORF Transcript_11926/g.38319 Transcript_11926/m.38319 type:complete len:269 (+) Transcript_11926:559-1365(+)